MCAHGIYLICAEQNALWDECGRNAAVPVKVWKYFQTGGEVKSPRRLATRMITSNLYDIRQPISCCQFEIRLTHTTSARWTLANLLICPWQIMSLMTSINAWSNGIIFHSNASVPCVRRPHDICFGIRFKVSIFRAQAGSWIMARNELQTKPQWNGMARDNVSPKHRHN